MVGRDEGRKDGGRATTAFFLRQWCSALVVHSGPAYMPVPSTCNASRPPLLSCDYALSVCPAFL